MTLACVRLTQKLVITATECEILTPNDRCGRAVEIHLLGLRCGVIADDVVN